MRVNIKKLHPDAVIPQYSRFGDAGMDLTATSLTENGYGNLIYGTGLAFEIPAGYVGLIYPRSSVYKRGLQLCNSVGVIDSGYRGEVLVTFTENWVFSNLGKGFEMYKTGGMKTYEIGDRVAQIIIMPYPRIQFVEKETLSNTERGSGGFGSTDH